MKYDENYWTRQLAHCDEILALCARPPTPERVADAEAHLQRREREAQAQLDLRIAA